MAEEVNFLMETVTFLSRLDREPDDIDWVGSADGEYAIPWGQFEAIAAGVFYDPDDDCTPVAGDLVIVFKDCTWLVRVDTPTSRDEWVLRRCPQKKSNAQSFGRICGYCMNAANWDVPDTPARRGRSRKMEG